MFSELPVGRELLNSTLICVLSILLILAVSTTAGFAFAKLRYRASGWVFLGVVAALMVPLQSIIIPEYVNLGKLGLINTYLGAILVYVALGTPFATFLMTTYFRRLPEDVIEEYTRKEVEPLDFGEMADLGRDFLARLASKSPQAV